MSIHTLLLGCNTTSIVSTIICALAKILLTYFYESLIKIESKSSGDAKSKASGHWRMLEDPEFIIAIVVAQYVLSFLKPLKLFLQKTNCDMVVAFDEAQNTLNKLKEFSLERILL
jgi:hypothetical protein